jgi:hypothetical protein
MANTKENVTTGKPKVGGAVFRAPIGTTLPTDAVTALNEAFVSQGYCSDEGLKNNGSRTTQDIRAWGGDVVDSAQTEKNDVFTVTLIEAMNAEVLKTVHGDDNVTGTLAEGLSVSVNSKELPESCWVVDMVLRGNVAKRVVLPCGRVTNVAEVTYDDDSPVGYQLTISAYPDSSGNTHYEYLKKGQSVSSGEE